jgi:DNA replication initiation complex subunit (GINS family)
MINRNALKSYVENDHNLTGADFEKKWYESVLMVLSRIESDFYNPVEATIKLIEINNGLQWVQENLNEQLNSQHRTLLKNIFSVNIQILNGAVITRDLTYLPIVIESIKTILGPYNRDTSAE